ncbi:unnamed protein product [Brassica rapa subsp. trilocularis]
MNSNFIEINLAASIGFKQSFTQECKTRKMDSKKKEKAEKLRRKKAAVHAKAQEKKARAQTRRAQEILDAEDEAATFQATGQIPNRSSCSCF